MGVNPEELGNYMERNIVFQSILNKNGLRDYSSRLILSQQKKNS